MNQRVIISNDIQTVLTKVLQNGEYDYLFAVADDTTAQLCWSRIKDFSILHDAQLITIPPTDINKNLPSVTKVWTALQQGHATRHSCIINVGGGMVTDLGGFAASTFKRGIQFINIPTTLLSMIDASVGGKTGINFNGLKNEVGVFNDSKFVLLYAPFLQTLDKENMLSGYAEMLKHALINTHEMLAQLLLFNWVGDIDYQQLQQMIADSVSVKEKIVAIDPHEKGIRKALNLGHTFGHAFESWAMNMRQQHSCCSMENNAHSSHPCIKPILHGYAVAYGLVCELYLSCIKCGFPTEVMRQVVRFIKEHYGSLPFTCNDYSALITLMHHDKKNTGNSINCTLLSDVGQIHIDQTVSMEDIKEALDFLREA